MTPENTSYPQRVKKFFKIIFLKETDMIKIIIKLTPEESFGQEMIILIIKGYLPTGRQASDN